MPLISVEEELSDPALASEPAPSPQAPANGTYGQILRSSAIIGGSSVLNIAVGIVRTKVMALLLGPAGFGMLSIYGSIATLTQTFAGMGINSSGVRQIAEAAGSGDEDWRSQAFVRQCLPTLFGNNTTLTCEIIVIDNASFDGVAGMLAAEFPQVIFLQCDHNVGFAAANNLAFTRSRGRYILFLNPDTEVQGQAIQTLVSALDLLPNAGMVGARLLNSDLSLQTTCITSAPALLNQTLNSDLLRTAFPRWKLWGMGALFDGSRSPVQVEAISGACMMARRRVLDRVGAFSTEYFMYAEDMDLCVKITRAGSAIYYVPDAIIIHHGGGSSTLRRESSFSSIMVRESLVRFFALHRGKPYAALYRTSLVFASAFRILFLALAFPVLLQRRGFSLGAQPLRKWSSIFLWSLGLTPWAARRPQEQPSPTAKPRSLPQGPALHPQ